MQRPTLTTELRLHPVLGCEVLKEIPRICDHMQPGDRSYERALRKGVVKGASWQSRVEES